jgi:hypothetical protein
MCRSHRRCPSSSHRHRTRALNTANRRVQRARNALRDARAAGEPEAITSAEQRLTAAQANRADVAAAHPLPQDRGHDTTGNQHTDHGADDRHTGSQQADTPAPAEIATPNQVETLRRAHAEADERWMRTEDAVDAIRASSDWSGLAAAEDAANQARQARNDARWALHDAEAAAQPTQHGGHDVRVTGRGNTTITGHTGPLDIHHTGHTPDAHGNITITGGDAVHTSSPPNPSDQADRAEQARAHTDQAMKHVAAAIDQARRAATTTGATSTVTGDGRVTISGVTGPVYVNGKRVR